jgi:hypothetical protein
MNNDAMILRNDINTLNRIFLKVSVYQPMLKIAFLNSEIMNLLKQVRM